MAKGLIVCFALALVVGVAWALRPVRTSGPVTPSEAWLAAERHARRVTAVAWCLLVPVPLLALLLVTPYLQALAVGALTAALPLLAGTAFVAVHVVGEVTWPRPAGAVRRAPLVRRRLADLAPRALSVLTGAWTLLLVLLLVVCGAAAGTGGRSLSYAHADGTTSTASPFPGWYYGRLVVGALVVLLVGCLAALVLVARRAAVADTDPVDDVALRRTSARRVLSGVQLVVGATLAGCLFFAANVVRVVEPRWADALGAGSAETVAAVAAVIAIGIGVTALVVAVRGARATLRPASAHVEQTPAAQAAA
ncbi:hypothetical protein [Cellulomonas terrae]|uniref:Uncharacterized protein n=1 Tax=Cellulomonas terrae TaxID=311234 RepID=A0A511JFJ5_9CELL|nr:hypothetical protein [Cellulomonas terrae]GEL96705.1 hypothetical protein CTE05_02520 [Cellulomonas terrae]